MATTVHTGFADSTPLLDRPQELRRRHEEDGFLFFRGLLPREDVLALRTDFLDILHRFGWLDESRGLTEGLADQAAVDAIPKDDIGFCGVGVPREAYEAVQRLESFHALAHHPRLISMYRSIFGADVLPHPRNIARLMLPTGNNAPTPPHQDYIHIQGTTNVRTCWIPIGDCPRQLGGLSVLRGSHKDGVLPVHAAEGAGNLEVYLCNTNYEWVVDDYQAGDVLTFESRTVHKALPNKTGPYVRLSCDYRYQPADEEIEQKSLRTHCNVLDWDEIYRDWSREDLKYYWRRRTLTMGEWDETLHWQKDHICD